MAAGVGLFALFGTKFMPFMTSGEWKEVSKTAVAGKRLMGTAHALIISTLITEPWSLQGSHSDPVHFSNHLTVSAFLLEKALWTHCMVSAVVLFR